MKDGVEVDVVASWETNEIQIQVWFEGAIVETAHIPRRKAEDVIDGIRHAVSQIENLDEEYQEHLREKEEDAGTFEPPNF
jgi:hypothetical protein